jgi:hypothetical protein
MKSNRPIARPSRPSRSASRGCAGRLDREHPEPGLDSDRQLVHVALVRLRYPTRDLSIGHNLLFAIEGPNPHLSRLRYHNDAPRWLESSSRPRSRVGP